MNHTTRFAKLAGVAALTLLAPGPWADPDVNDDGFVNQFDMGIFRQCFFQVVEAVPSCQPVDQNGDGIINAIDLGALSQFYLQYYPAPDASTKWFPSLIVPIDARSFVGVGDFTGDNVPDLLGATSASGGKLTLAAGAGDGTFVEIAEQYIGCASEDFILRDGILLDLNDDQSPDIVGICSKASADDVLTVYRNVDGTTFALAESFPLIGANNEIRLGDVDADGAMDFLIAQVRFFDPVDTALIFGNNGDGTLSPLAEVPLPTDITSIAFGDVDADGFADIAYIEEHAGSPFTGRLSVRSGDGEGAFGLPTLVDDDVSASWLRIADLNADDAPDIVTCCFPSLQILVGDMAGGLLPSVNIGGFITGDFVALEDLNMDTHLDLVLSDSDGIFNSYLFVPDTGVPDVSFGSFSSVGLGAYFDAGTKTTVADVSSDGYPDFISPGSFGVSTKALMEPDPVFPNAPTFEEPQLLFGTNFFTQIEIADVNDDELTDVIAVSVSTTNLSEVRVYYGSTDGVLVPGERSFDQGRVFGIDSGDLNGDEIIDIALARGSNETVTLFYGDGTGQFVNSATLSFGGRDVAILDLNGDVPRDLAVSSWSGDEVVLLEGDGLGGFTATQTISFDTTASKVKSEDLDLDGANDLIIAQNYALNVFMNSGDDGFTPAASIQVGKSTPFSVLRDFAIGHLDDDDYPDIAVSTSGANVGPAHILLFEGNGDGTFDLQTDYVMPAPLNVRQPNSIRIADVNDDAFPDLVVQEDFENVAYVYFGADHYQYNKYQKYGPMYHQGSSFSAKVAEVADVNGDGRPDILRSAGNGPYVISVLLHTGTTQEQGRPVQ